MRSLTLALSLWSATALAQEVTPTATPAPAEMEMRRQSSIPEPGITPSFGVLQAGVFVRDARVDGGIQYETAFPIFAGATLHAMPSRVSPFSNVGVEMDWRPFSNHIEWVPMGRFGVAILGNDMKNDYWRRLLPLFQLYGIAGYRIPGELRGGAARLGVGLGSPFLMAATLGSGKTCVPAPMMIEGTVDVADFKGGKREYQLRVGWFF